MTVLQESNRKRNESSLIPSLTLEESEFALAKFREFLHFETVSNDAPTSGAYVKCANWLVEYLRSVECFDSVFLLEEAPSHSPVVVAHWKGRNAALPVVLLNSHYDVVPADPNAWTVPPFAAVRQHGNIYGRGTQDMKCVCIQYVEAIRKITTASDAFVPERSVYLTFVPDEEVGGGGMAAFLESSLYNSLPSIALALDEGLASTTESFSVFYGERIPWFVDVTATGPTGHGSRFIDNTAVEQIVALANKALEFRQGQRDKLLLGKHENCAHAVAAKTLGDVTSLNITTLQAGVKSGTTFAFNCVPPLAKCSLDIRISPHVDPAEIGAMLDLWCQECSSDDSNYQLSWTYIGQGHDAQKHSLTPTNATVNPWYGVFTRAMSNMALTVGASIFPAATDSRFLRALGVRALGFSPMRSTATTPCEIMLHENDEYIPEATFLEGIGVYVGLIRELASQGQDMDA
jgi:aminoacylase